MDVDVVVIGLGSVGSMALWQLATTTDLRVAGIEQYGIGHTRGSYAGESRVFRTAYHEGALYVPLLLRSRELWIDLERQAARPMFIPTGTLSVGRPDNPPFLATLQTVREFDLPHRYLDTAQLRDEFPQHMVHDGVEAILDLHGGALRSEVAVLAAVDLAVRSDATALTDDGAVGIDESGERIVVTLASGRTIRATRVISTVGSWSAQLLPALSDLITITPVALTWFAPRQAARYTPDRFPAFLRDQDGVHMFGVPTLDGYSIKVVSHNDDEALVPSTVDGLATGLSRHALRQISRNAQSFFADLSPEPVRHSLHHDGYTSSRVPIVDRDASGRIITVAGLSGHGFKMATGLAQLAVGLATDRADALMRPEFALEAHQSP